MGESPWPQGSQTWLVREQSKEGTEGKDTLEMHFREDRFPEPRGRARGGGLKEAAPEEGLIHPTTRMGKLRLMEPSQSREAGAGTARDPGEIQKWRLH